MTSYSVEQHVQMVKLYYENGCSIVATMPRFQQQKNHLQQRGPFLDDGYVNKQNCRIWDDANQHEVNQVAMHPQKVPVWCGLWAGGIIGPNFFENDDGIAITVNEERYRSMITNLFWLKWIYLDVDEMWFQQDGATCYTTHATMDILCKRFEGMVMSRGGDVNWPPRSCDLTPLNFFSCGGFLSRRSLPTSCKRLVPSKST